jgi:hypothetical protein
MSTSQKPGGGLFQSLNVRPDCRVEARTPPLAAARRDPYIAEQAVDGCSADGENTSAIRPVKRQSAVSLKCRQ